MTLLMTTFKTSVYTEVFYGDLFPNPYSIFETIHFKEHLC